MGEQVGMQALSAAKLDALVPARPGHSSPPLYCYCSISQSAHITTNLELLYVLRHLQVIHYLTLTSGDDTNAYRGHGTSRPQ